jgi:hypothetical protein
VAGRGGGAARPLSPLTAALAPLLVVLLVLLTGCGGLPESGPAGPGRAVDGIDRAPPGEVPQGPRPGAEPEEMVGGFLRAGGKGFDDDHSVARTFLTGRATTQWEPSRQTLVYSDDISLTTTERGTGNRREVVVRAPVWATLSPAGQLQLAAPGERAEQRFWMVRRAADWRVESTGDRFGLWMSRVDFEHAYTPVRVTFLATGTQALVPDLRWFPRAGLATAVVRSLLAGPPQYLGRAVRTGAPPGTRLAVDAVPTTDGLATVDLSEEALGATPEQRRLLLAQLSTTLRQLKMVSQVALTVGGVEYPVGPVKEAAPAGALGYVDDVRVTGSPLVLGAGRLWHVDDADTLAPGPGSHFVGPADVSGLRSLAAGPGRNVLVGVDRSGRRLLALSATGPTVTVARGGDLDTPVLDATGWAWTADQDRRGELLVTPVATGGTEPRAVGPRVLRPAWLAGRKVVSVDVSRDRARVAIVSRDATGRWRIDVAGISRSADGRPERIDAHRPVGQSLGYPRVVAWADRTQLVVLAGTGPRGVRAYQVEVGGPVSPLPPVEAPEGIWAGDGLRAVYVTTRDGSVLVGSGSGWQSVGRGIAVTVPQ